MPYSGIGSNRRDRSGTVLGRSSDALLDRSSAPGSFKDIMQSAHYVSLRGSACLIAQVHICLYVHLNSQSEMYAMLMCTFLTLTFSSSMLAEIIMPIERHRTPTIEILTLTFTVTLTFEMPCTNHKQSWVVPFTCACH